MNPLNKLLKTYRVKSFKSTSAGLAAIKKFIAGEGFMWLYFQYDLSQDSYIKTGSTRRFRR